MGVQIGVRVQVLFWGCVWGCSRARPEPSVAAQDTQWFLLSFNSDRTLRFLSEANICKLKCTHTCLLKLVGLGWLFVARCWLLVVHCFFVVGGWWLVVVGGGGGWSWLVVVNGGWWMVGGWLVVVAGWRLGVSVCWLLFPC